MPDRRHHIPADLREHSELYKIIKTTTWLRQKPSGLGAIDSQLLFGEGFRVYKTHKDWMFGQVEPWSSESRFKGYVGWVKRSALALHAPKADEDLSYRVSVLRAPLFARPNIKHPFVRQGLEGGLSLNSKIEIEAKITGHDGTEFYKLLGLNAYVHIKHLRLEDGHVDLDFVSVAEHHMGLPYVWGGVSASGLDCSGLVRSALRASGQDGPRDADQQEAALGTELPSSKRDSLEGLKRGDLVFWPGHVGIMQSPTHMVHANAFHMCVQSEPLKTAARRINKAAGPIRQIKRLAG